MDISNVVYSQISTAHILMTCLPAVECGQATNLARSSYLTVKKVTLTKHCHHPFRSETETLSLCFTTFSNIAFRMIIEFIWERIYFWAISQSVLPQISFISHFWIWRKQNELNSGFVWLIKTNTSYDHCKTS